METSQRQPRRNPAALISIVLASGLLIATYLALRASSEDRSSRAPVAHVFQIAIASDADTLTALAQRGVPTFKARQGDAVTLVAPSTQSGSLHVHVYDRNVALVLGGEARLTFEATTAGAFPIHWHDPQNLMIHLAILEVQPR